MQQDVVKIDHGFTICLNIHEHILRPVVNVKSWRLPCRNYNFTRIIPEWNILPDPAVCMDIVRARMRAAL